MILSRVADALYWMGRYLERAENTVRLLLVAEELSTEVFGLDEDLARSEWHDLGEIFPGPALPERTTRQVASLAAISLQALTFSAAHPNSVYFSLKRARDNARGVREALTLEVFVNLNETYRELEEAAKRRLVDTPSFRSALGSTHRGILATVGSVEHTLTRQPGWLFLRLGESMERLYRTAAVLRVKLPASSCRSPRWTCRFSIRAGGASCAGSRASRPSASRTGRDWSPWRCCISSSSTARLPARSATAPPR